MSNIFLDMFIDASIDLWDKVYPYIEDHWAKGVFLGTNIPLAAYSYKKVRNKLLPHILDKKYPDVYNASDLTKHTLIIGVQGSGKSNKLKRISVNSLIKKDLGLMYICTHGTATDIMRSIPKERWDDVIYIAPWMKRVYGINILQRYSNDSDEVDRIAEDVTQVFKKIYSRSWGDKLELTIKFAVKAVLIASDNCETYKNPTLMDVHKVITNEIFRKKLFNYVENDIITGFFEGLKQNSSAQKLENP